MATTINAGTTTGTSFQIVPDTTGAMNIQTSGATAVSIDSSQAVTLTHPLPAGSGGTGITSLGSGVATFLGTPSSANLAAAVSDETGTGSLVFSISPAFTGIPTAPTAATGTNTTQIATTAFVNSSIIPSGTAMLFYQASAPTGWTKVTSINDYGLRVVSGSGGTTGGTSAFSSVFTNQTPTINSSGLSVGATTLSIDQMPSHNHPGNQSTGYYGSYTGTLVGYGILSGSNLTVQTNSVLSQGGGGSHTHGISGSVTSSAITLDLQYANVIICTKN